MDEVLVHARIELVLRICAKNCTTSRPKRNSFVVCVVWIKSLFAKQVFKPHAHLMLTSEMKKKTLNLPANLERHSLANSFNERFESAMHIAKKRTDVAVCFQPFSVTRIGRNRRVVCDTPRVAC